MVRNSRHAGLDNVVVARILILSRGRPERRVGMAGSYYGGKRVLAVNRGRRSLMVWGAGSIMPPTFA